MAHRTAKPLLLAAALTLGGLAFAPGQASAQGYYDRGYYNYGSGYDNSSAYDRDRNRQRGGMDAMARDQYDRGYRMGRDDERRTRSQNAGDRSRYSGSYYDGGYRTSNNDRDDGWFD